MMVVAAEPTQRSVTILKKFDVRASIAGRLPKQVADLVGCVSLKAECHPKIRRDGRDFDSGRESGDRVHAASWSISLNEDARTVVMRALLAKIIPKGFQSVGRDLNIRLLP